MNKISYFVLVGTICWAAHADIAPTTQNYVDDGLATKEAILTAKPNDMIVTYPSANGQRTEHLIKSNLGDSTNDAAIATVGGAKNKIDTRQDKVFGVVNPTAMAYGATPGAIKVHRVFDDENMPVNSGLISANMFTYMLTDAVNSELTPVSGVGWQINTTPTFSDFVLPIENVATYSTKGKVNSNGIIIYIINVADGNTGTFGWGDYSIPIVNGKAKLPVPADKTCSTAVPAVATVGYMVDDVVIQNAAPFDLTGATELEGITAASNCYIPSFVHPQKWVYCGTGQATLTDQGNMKNCTCATTCVNALTSSAEFRDIMFNGN